MGTLILSLVALFLVGANSILYSALYGPQVETWLGIMKAVGSWGLVAALVLSCVFIPFVIAMRWSGGRKKKTLQTQKFRLLNWVVLVWNGLCLGLFFFINPYPLPALLQNDGMWLVDFAQGTVQEEEAWIVVEQTGGTETTKDTEHSESASLKFPNFQSEQEAVEYALICAIRGQYALMFGTPEHLRPLAHCLTRRGAAAMGMTLVATEAAGGAFVGIASGLSKQVGGNSKKLEEAKKKMEKRMERLEKVLVRYNIPMSTPKWNDELMDQLAPRGRKFFLDVLPFWEETIEIKEARKAEKGGDPQRDRERHSRDVIGMARHAVGFATYTQESGETFNIQFPAEKDEGFPNHAMFEDGHWRINWPRSKD